MDIPSQLVRSERSLKFIRWQIAYNVLNTHATEANDPKTKEGLVRLSHDYLLVINMCNEGLGEPSVDEETLRSRQYLSSFLEQGLPV